MGVLAAGWAGYGGAVPRSGMSPLEVPFLESVIKARSDEWENDMIIQEGQGSVPYDTCVKAGSKRMAWCFQELKNVSRIKEYKKNLTQAAGGIFIGISLGFNGLQQFWYALGEDVFKLGGC
ncbi:hypothetical protein NPIL_341861 [Nephila pilipes]|uniref:Uncharacterized protein n=1 Tax=Nephila pilipes TaxID=299642 RepID=A0A8X6PST0_NEPPI|nr:hypothetical protein NPIL_341861 [Nephila pilipes]